MLFRLKPKVGNHVERDDNDIPKVYKSGDVVQSKQDLTKLFKGKFIRVDKDREKEDPQTFPDIPMASEGVDLDKSIPSTRGLEQDVEIEADAED